MLLFILLSFHITHKVCKNIGFISLYSFLSYCIDIDLIKQIFTYILKLNNFLVYYYLFNASIKIDIFIIHSINFSKIRFLTLAISFDNHLFPYFIELLSNFYIDSLFALMIRELYNNFLRQFQSDL
jgi:hypothetical protein